MSSVRHRGIRFTIYPQDHEPRHVHGFVAGAEVIVDLRSDRTVALAARVDAVRGRAKRSDVRAVLEQAAEHYDELVALWNKMHAENVSEDD